MEALLCTIAGCAALVTLTTPAFAASGMPADTEQIFGVGARADAMGDAFVAVANDPTAAFWNPAGLSLLQKIELTAVTKSLPGFTQATVIQDTGVDDEFPEFPGFGSVTFSDTTSNHASASVATFLSVTAPIGKDPTRHGTIAISRALAGFFDRDWTVRQNFITADPGDAETLITSVRDRMRVDYNSITYGWKHSEAWSTGVGVVQAVARASTVGSTQQTFLQPGPEPFEGTIGPESTEGKGYGCILGALWTPKWAGTGTLTFGGSYLTKITLRDFDSSSFGDERPDRLLLGANYRQVIPGSETDNEVQWSLQLSRNGSANASDGDQVVRNPVWNFYFGGEYDIHRARINWPIRCGLFTNRSPNNSVYGSETWMTVGFGASPTRADWQAEFALQQGLRTGMSLISFSGGYSF